MEPESVSRVGDKQCVWGLAMKTSFFVAAVASVTLVAASGSAFAADLARRAPVAAPYEQPISVYNWTGFYAGANVGGEFLRNTATNAGLSNKLNSASVFGGVQAGYNWQTGPWVLGAEADIGYGHPSKTKAFGINTLKTEEGVAGTVRARAGYAFDRFLVYGTGGLAWANFDTRANDGFTSEKKNDTRVGWTVGGGLEYAVTNNVSVKGEYLYEDFGHQNTTFTNVGPVRQGLTEHLVRVGVNYKF